MHLEQVYESSPDGVMQLAGHDVRELLDEFGSPLIVMLEDVIRFNCRAYRRAVERYPRSRVYYASKALLTTGLCTLFEQEGLGPDYVLLGEPTDLQVFRGQRGRMEMEITTTGKSAHGAHNRRGINAIYKMNPIVRAIERLDRSLPPVKPLGRGSITVSDIRSRGPSLCSVPDHCRIHIDRRLTVGETRESALAQLEEIVQGSGGEASVSIPEYAGTSWKGTEFSQEAYFPTWIMEEDHPLVQAGLETARIVLGKKTKSSFWSFSTNGVATAGRHELATIGFAPGKEELAHSTREEIVLQDLFKAAEFYALFPFVLTGKI